MQSLEERYRRKRKTEKLIILIASLILAFGLAVLLYQVPAIRQRVDWRIETSRVFLRSLVNPIGDLPTAIAHDSRTEAALPLATDTPTATITSSALPYTSTPGAFQAAPTLTPTPTASPLPAQVELDAPPFEGQDWNNCGPVSLSMYMNFYGWGGDQYDISDQIKPLRADRNVNIEELVQYVQQNVWSLNAIYRVGGDIDLLRKILAAGFPVMVEETMFMHEDFWFNDDRWAGHYLLLTGYDNVRQQFTTQDSFVGPNRKVSYLELDQNWQAFNRVYMLVYPTEQAETIQSLLGEDWDADQNRRNALAKAENETKTDPLNPFPWFNLGSNQLYFSHYTEAAAAYDQARSLELPQRMLRYQFGPFMTYFHTGRYDELLALAEYALTVTPNSEEALLWKGWALYRLNRQAEALTAFQEALEYRPGYPDAVYAIGFVQGK